MKKTIIYLLIFCSPFFANGQNWGEYSSFYSKGDIPADFTDDFAQKYEKMKENISKDANRKEQANEDQFYKRSEYYINDFLVSGNVVFGDTISLYCSAILDRLLVNNQNLRKRLRVYTVKSPEFNAYATESGIIFVNAGLLAEIENEAQLAFILAHEVIHFEESHVLSEYVEKTKLDKEKIYYQEDLDTRLKTLSNYSKGQELEADRYGFERYYNHMGYADIEAVYLMDIMQYSYLPFDEIPFEYSFLETDEFKIQDDYRLDIINEISTEDDYDDSMSSHPNIRSRRDSIETVVGTSTGSQFVVSKDWFDYCQRLARYETCRMNLVRRDYPGAIYTAFLLSKKYGPDKFQKEIVAKALQGASVYRNNNELSDITVDSDDIEGESQRVYHLLSKFRKKELNTLAVAYSYQVYKEFPDDKDVKLAYQHALYDLVNENRMELEDYGLKSYSEYQRAMNLLAKQNNRREADSLVQNDDAGLIDSAQVEMNVERERNSKISKIREKQTAIFEAPQDSSEATAASFNPEKLYLRAFLPFQTDSTFLSDFERYEKQYNSESSINRNNRNRNTGRSRFNDPVSLGIDTLLILNPLYVNLDERENDGVKFIRSVDRQQNYNKIIDKLADKIGLTLHRIDFKELNASETEIFNDLCVLKNWLEERLDHENSGARMSNYKEIQSIKEKYGLNYVSFTGNVSVREDKRKTGLIVTSLIMPPLLLVTLPLILKPSYISYNFFYVFDIDTGNALMAEYNYYPNADKDVYLKSITYNNLIQVKN